MQAPNLELNGKFMENKQMQDMATQLDTIFTVAPGKHEIRIIGRWHEVAYQGKKITKCFLEEKGERAQGFSIGLASSTKEAVQIIANHFNVDNQPLHNCFIVTNTVSDDFNLSLKKGKIGSNWFSDMAFFLTKATDIVAINSIIIDIDRAETNKNDRGEKLCASDKELETLDTGRKEILAFLETFGIKPAYQICSGNGYQMGIFFDPQLDTTIAKKTIENILKGMKQKFIASGIAVDTTLSDPSRVSRICGMLNKKYDRAEQHPDRVHRFSYLIDNNPIVNSWQSILALAANVEITKPSTKPAPAVIMPPANTEPATHTTKYTAPKDFDSEAYIREIIALNGLNVTKEKTDGPYKIMFCLDECLFDPSHKGNESSISISSNGKICYQCFHDHCKGNQWKDAKAKLRLPESKSYCKECGQEIQWEQNQKHQWRPKNIDGTPHKCKSKSKTTTTSTPAPNNPNDNIIWLDSKGRVVSGLAAKAFFDLQKETLLCVSGAFWRYGNGYWSKVNNEIIMQEIRDMIGRPKTTKKIIEDIKFCLELEAFRDQTFKWNPFPEKMCFQNCVLDTTTMTTQPHNKDLFQTTRFEWEYYPHGCPDISSFVLHMYENAPRWMDFLGSIGLDQDAIARLQEWMGLCLLPITKMERCLFLKGEGRNGKGVFLHVLRNLLGESQVSSLDLDQLFDRFSKIGIQNKLINISGDIDTDIVFSSKFKGMVSGEAVVAEDKYKKNETFFPYARFIFAANDFPPVKDRSAAFYKRFDIVEFPREIEEEKQNKDLKDQLLPELPEIMHWALEGLKRLMKNKWIFSVSAAFEETKEAFKLASNPVLQFVTSNFIINTKTPTPNKYNTQTFRRLYREWCVESGHHPLSEESLGKDMKRLGIKKERQTTGKRLYFYVGIEPIDSTLSKDGLCGVF